MMEPHDCNFRDDIGCINDRCPLHRAMQTLAHNLATGAGLCAAFELGYSDAEDNALYYRHGYRTEDRWTPGCGRPNDWHVLP